MILTYVTDLDDGTDHYWCSPLNTLGPRNTLFLVINSWYGPLIDDHALNHYQKYGHIDSNEIQYVSTMSRVYS